MKKILKTLFVTLISFVSTTTNAQSSKKDNSLLWEISGNGLTKPSYIYGTVHMICDADFQLKQKTTTAFDKATKLVLELNMADPNEIKQLQELAMAKEPLSKKLTKEQLERLDKVLQKEAGMNVAQVDNFSLITVMSIISMKSFGCTNLKFYENEFIKKAKKKNIPVGGLEKSTEQIDFLSKAFPDDEMINTLEKTNKELTAKLISIYKNENINDLYAFTTDKDIMSDESIKWLLQYRNENWMKTIPSMIKNESVFFAVGAAHLGGEIGIINLLRKAGYTVKPILD